MKYLKQLLCKHVWIDDYITYKTIWPYIIGWQRVWRCAKCDRLKKEEEK